MSNEEGPAVAAIRGELDHLQEIETGLIADHGRLQAELAEARAAAAAAVLAERLEGVVAPRGQAKRVAELAAELEAVEGALKQLPARRQAVNARLFKARAAHERERCNVLLAEAEQNGRQTAGLLAELKKHEGCDYGPVYPGGPAVVANPDGSVRVVVPLSRTEQLRQEAASALDMARTYEGEAGRLTKAL